MKFAISLGIALLIAGSCCAQSGFSGTVTDSNWGVKIWFESKFEPPTADVAFKGKSGVMHLENGQLGMRRYTTNERTHEYFGYDMKIETLDRVEGTFRVSFAALPTDARALDLKDPETWRRATPPSFPPPEELNISDTIAVDLFENPGTGQRVVDYIHFSRDNCSPDIASPGQLVCLEGELKDLQRSLKDQLARAKSSQDPAIASRARDSQLTWESYLHASCGQLTSERDKVQCEIQLTRNRIHDLVAITGPQQ